MPGEANQGRQGRRGMGRETLLGKQSPLSPYLPSAANTPAPGRQERALGGGGSARGGGGCAPTAPRPPLATAPALAQPGRGGLNQPPLGNDPACLVTHTQLVTKAN